MMQRIAARGVLVDADDRMLLVLEQVIPGVDEFWVLPGGGVDPTDASTLDCVRREFREETGLTVEAGPLLYVQELLESDGQMRHLMLIFLVHSPTGELHQADRNQPLQGTDLQRHTGWFSQEQLQSMRVYPEELREKFWNDRSAGELHGKYLMCKIKTY